jgi:phosphoenolpyruvate carboxylase
MKRYKAADLFDKDLERLQGELSITNCSDELRAVVGNVREPYKEYLAPVRSNLCTYFCSTIVPAYLTPPCL